jgi:hypothetical protein
MDDVVTSIYSILDEEKARYNMAVHVVTEDVVDLNDKAVASMLRSDFQGALQSLQVALARILSLQAQPSTMRSSAYFGDSSTSNDESPIASIPLTSSPVNSEAFDGIFLLFNRALVIPRHCDFDLHCPKHQSRALATVLYNVALVYHIESMRQGQHQTMLLKHALQYYGYAYRAIESAAQEYGFEDVLLLLLALFNNMGHVHTMLLDDANLTRQCLRWMQATFANPRIKRLLFPEDYQFFFQYISMVASQQLLLAPAA